MIETAAPRILDAKSLEDSLSGQAGGKATNLARLSRAGLDVPEWFCISTVAFDEAVRKAAFWAEIEAMLAKLDASDLAAVSKVSDAIRSKIRAAPLSADARAAILDAARARFAPDDFLAVRSSAIGEDSGAASFAGQHDTFLFVRGDDAIIDSIRACWASAFGDRAIAYRVKQGMDPRAALVAVVVQRMVEGEVSGVLFTADPASGDRAVSVISATWGLGEGIVSGALSTDDYRVARGGREVSVSIVEKETRIVFDREKGGGTREEAVPAEMQARSALAVEEAAALAGIGERIEALYGGVPQDIEWTRAKGKFHILQARPITTLASTASKPAPAVNSLAPGREIVWDNSNIIESYSGVTSPLTYSYARYAYSVAYQQSCEIWGVPLDVVKAHEWTYRSMLGLLAGRVYYNLGSWYRLLSLFPNFEKNKAHMEQMMGVREATQFAESGYTGFTSREKRGVKLAMLRNFVTAPRLVRRFFENFRRHYDKHARTDWRTVEPLGIVDAMRELFWRILWHWQAPLVSDALAMRYYGDLKNMVETWKLDESGSLANDLLCGEGGLESTEPTKGIIRLALEARKDADLTALLSKTPDGACMKALEDPRWAGFLGRVRAYLDAWGFRCMNELKLEEKSLRDEPAFLFAMLKNYLAQKELDLEAMERREKEVRSRAEAVVASKLSGLKRWRFNRALRGARLHVKNRENMRLARTKTFGLVREMFNALGGHYHRMGKLAEPHDVYYLTLDEVLGFADGSTTCTDLGGLAAVRKAEFERFRATEIDDRIRTRGAVHHGNELSSKPVEATSDDGVLRGVPCCPGVVRAKARVIRSPKDDMQLRGEILVAARTDPGWVPLFPSASGLLIERGSLLSHSAIVARELGLPTIVNIPRLLERVKDGDLVEMDGKAGTARIIEAAQTK